MADIYKKNKKMKKSFHSDSKRPKRFYKIDLTMLLLIVTVCSIGFSIIYSIDPADYDQVDHTHEGIACSSCHDSDTYDLLKEPGELCLDCHGADGVMPVEEGHGFGMDCTTCHTIATPVETGDGEDDGEDGGETPTSFHPTIPEGTDCTSCHDITIKAHDTCTGCHDLESEIADTSLLCSDCHEDEYSEWEEGIHVSNHEEKICIDCHNPHEPYVIIDDTLPPVQSITSETEVPGPIMPPAIFFAVIIGALCAVVYMFYFRSA